MESVEFVAQVSFDDLVETIGDNCYPEDIQGLVLDLDMYLADAEFSEELLVQLLERFSQDTDNKEAANLASQLVEKLNKEQH